MCARKLDAIVAWACRGNTFAHMLRCPLERSNTPHSGQANVATKVQRRQCSIGPGRLQGGPSTMA
eukprot:4898399-Alexandrium_andersonii.AAC.1